MSKREILITEFYDGQGLGNQLWLYVATRCKARELGIGFGIKSPEKFKGFSLFDLDFGEQVYGGEGPEGGPPSQLPDGISNYFREKLERHPITGQDITSYSDDWNLIRPSTKLDGNFQGEKYIEKYKNEIAGWLKVVNPEYLEQTKDDLCVINFRGGEYKSIPRVFLPKQYWDDARKKMLDINPNMRFKVVTDDEKTAKKFFNVSEISYQPLRQDYIDINSAKYLIIANTSFAWFPSWLNINLELCIAPKYWWGYNTAEYWACGYNLTSTYNYLDQQGKLWSFDQCAAELGESKISPQTKGLPVATTSNRDPVQKNRINLDPNLRSQLKKITPKWLRNYLRFVQSFIRRQRLSIINEKVDPLTWMGSPLSEVLAEHDGKIYDCFYFFNELDTLEIRLEILNEHVDKFVIFESNRTFSGSPKESYFLANIERFERFSGKIIHYWLEDSPLDRDTVTAKIHDPSSSRLIKMIASRTLNSKNVPLGPGNSHWTVEAFQKEALHLAIEGLENNDLVFISDVDEIWNPEAKMRLRERRVYIFKQIPYMYKLNNRSNEHWHNWTGTVLATYGQIKDSCINDMRTHGRIPRIRVLNGGWHFSFQTNSLGIREKLVSYGHQEINTPQVHADLESTLNNNEDIRGRGAKFRKSEEDLPPFLLVNKSRFAHMFLE
jgi:Glycosyltransferase family 17